MRFLFYAAVASALSSAAFATKPCPDPASVKDNASLVFSADILEVGIDEDGYNACRSRPQTDAGCALAQYLTAEVQPFDWKKGEHVKGPLTLKSRWCAPYLPLRGGRFRFYVTPETTGKETTYRYNYYEPANR